MFGSLKAERLHGPCLETRRQARDEVIAWLVWYNTARLHSTLTYVSPVRFEQNWFAAQARLGVCAAERPRPAAGGRKGVTFAIG